MNEIKYILEQIRKTKTTVLIIILLGFILFYYKPLVTTVVTKKIERVDEVKKDITNNVLIQQMLNELMLKYNADRAYIFQFHNTIKYYDGTHRNHQSMTFEVCNNGISSEAQSLQNIPVSLYPLFLQQIMLERMNYCDVNLIKEQTTKSSLIRQGIKSVCIAPYFKNGAFVAYIGLDYVKDGKCTEVDFKEFKQFTNQIGNILML
jgi:hypothetical protein